MAAFQIFSLLFCSLFQKQWGNILVDRCHHRRDANLVLKTVQYVEIQKYSNCSPLDLFVIHQQMLTDGPCGHDTYFTEMFLFALPVFEVGSVVCCLCFTCRFLEKHMYFIFHHSEVCGEHLTVWYRLFLHADHCVLSDTSPAVCNPLCSW